MLAIASKMALVALGDLKVAFTWLRGLSWSQLLCLALAGLCLLFYAQRNDARSDADRWEKQFRSERTARIADRMRYRQAQAAAAARNQAEVDRIEADQERISNEVESNLRARLERLRRELQPRPAAPQGVAGVAGLPASGAPAGGTDEAPGVCLTPGELLRGAENEERYDQLISWIERQLGVKR